MTSSSGALEGANEWAQGFSPGRYHPHTGRIRARVREILEFYENVAS
ncbi:MAG: hypothetical protein QOJ42_6277, partial [Acidobacteriaceae bacterium]|nr:hypothetical protein [Acidobacteriaceae bacterium]